jgi:type I restriction enzyme S subunit
VSLKLSEHLPLIASAPGGIQKLRGLILELAVRGKLLPQEPSDEPATKLLERIEQEQKVLAKAGAYKKTKSIPQPATEGQPFDLPKSWAWTNFANVTSYIQRGKGPSYTDKSDYVVVSQKCVRWNGLDLSQARCITPESFSKYDAIRLLRCGDVLWNSTGTGTIGRAVIVPNLSEDQLLVADSHVTVVRPIIISPDYLWRWIQTPTVQNTIESMASGSTNQIELATSTVTAHPIPIPPLAEQHRIVAKVDELMALCDRLESEQNNSAAAHRQLVETLLGTLTQSTDAADFEANWQRIAEHFDTLFTTEASIDALQRTILQLAVMGKLVRQDPSEEAASLLLERIALDRKKLEADGTCKKLKQAPSPAESDQALPLPNGWEWTRLGAMLSKIGAGSTPLGGKQVYVKQGIMFLRSQNVWNDGLHLDDVAFILPETHKKMSGTHVEPGDILFNITGASIGRCAMVPESFITGNVSQHVTIIRPITKEISRFLHKLLISELIQKAVMDVQVGVSREGLSIGKLAQFLIPMPPLAEQHRIVAKVDELMAVCDQLKASIKTATAAQSTLSSALIQQTLEAA